MPGPFLLAGVVAVEATAVRCKVAVVLSALVTSVDPQKERSKWEEWFCRSFLENALENCQL